MGCSNTPTPIVPGRDVCMHCKMAISDVRFASQYVTNKGKRYTFDSVECLIRSLPNRGNDAVVIWLPDYEMPNTFITADEAVILHGDAIHSPMGAGLASFGSSVAEDALRDKHGGTTMDWEDAVVWLVEKDREETAKQ